MQRALNNWKRFWEEEDGLGTLEIILIIAVIIIIAIAFRKWIIHWVQMLLNGSTDEINNNFQDNVDLNFE